MRRGLVHNHLNTGEELTAKIVSLLKHGFNVKALEVEIFSFLIDYKITP